MTTPVFSTATCFAATSEHDSAVLCTHTCTSHSTCFVRYAKSECDSAPLKPQHNVGREFPPFETQHNRCYFVRQAPAAVEKTGRTTEKNARRDAAKRKDETQK